MNINLSSDRFVLRRDSLVPAFAVLLMGGLYVITYPVVYSWESYLWTGAIEGWLSLVDLYRAIHPDRPVLPEFINVYHPNHPLPHLIVALLHIPADLFGCCTALTLWRTINTFSVLVLLVMVYRLARLLGGSVGCSVLALVFVGAGNAIWYEAIAADAHIAAAAAGSVVIYRALRILNGHPMTKWSISGFGLSAVVAIGLHLNAAIAVAYVLGLLLWYRQDLHVAPQMVRRTAGTIVVVSAALYVLPFIGHLMPFSWASIRETYVLNPAHGSVMSPGYGLLGVTGISGFIRAIFPGYTPGLAVLQILAVFVLVLPCAATFFMGRMTADMKRLLGLALVYQLWIAGVVQSPNTTNYWIHHVWLVQLVAVLALFRVAPRMVAVTTTAVLILLAGSLTYRLEIAPKRELAMTEIAFSLNQLDTLRRYEQIAVGVADPHQMLVEAAALSQYFSTEALTVVFTAAGSAFEMPQHIRKHTVAVLVSSSRDPLYRAFIEDPCYTLLAEDRRREALPSSWFRFSTDWGFGHQATYNKQLLFGGFEYRPEGSGRLLCKNPIYFGFLDSFHAVTQQIIEPNGP